MSEIAYTVWPNKIPKYFEKIQETGVPDSVDGNWLRQCGFNSGNDSYILKVLKFIKFTDSSKTPTKLWQKYKSPTDAGKILAQGIQEGYDELFGMYPDAYQKDQETLYAYFSSKTGKAKATVNYIVRTFLKLCELADFSKLPKGATVISGIKGGAQETGMADLGRIVSGKGLLSEIHINIQLQLPPSTDPQVYDALFKSLKKNLLSAEE